MAQGNIYPLHTQALNEKHNLFDLQHSEDLHRQKFTALRRSLKTSHGTLCGRVARQGRTQVAWSVITSPLMTSQTAIQQQQLTTTQSSVPFGANFAMGDTKHIPQIHNGQDMNLTKFPVPNGCLKQQSPYLPERSMNVPMMSNTIAHQTCGQIDTRKPFLECLMEQRSQQLAAKQVVGSVIHSPAPPSNDKPTNHPQATFRYTKNFHHPTHTHQGQYYNENSVDLKQNRKVLYRVSFAKSASTLRNRNPAPRNNSPYDVTLNQEEWPPSLLRLKLREDNRRRTQSAQAVKNNNIVSEQTTSSAINKTSNDKVDNPSFCVNAPQLTTDLSIQDIRKKNLPVFRVNTTRSQKHLVRHESADEIIMRRSIEKVQSWINNLPMHFHTIHHVLPPVKQDY